MYLPTDSHNQVQRDFPACTKLTAVHVCLKLFKLAGKVLRGVYMRGKYLCKNSYLGIKEGGGHLLEGDKFSGTYGTAKALQHYSVFTEL